MLTVTRETSPAGETSPVYEGDHVEVLCGTGEDRHYRDATVIRTWYAPGHGFGRHWAVEVEVDGLGRSTLYVDFNGYGLAGRGWPVMRPSNPF